MEGRLGEAARVLAARGGEQSRHAREPGGERSRGRVESKVEHKSIRSEALQSLSRTVFQGGHLEQLQTREQAVLDVIDGPPAAEATWRKVAGRRDGGHEWAVEREDAVLVAARWVQKVCAAEQQAAQRLQAWQCEEQLVETKIALGKAEHLQLRQPRQGFQRALRQLQA